MSARKRAVSLTVLSLGLVAAFLSVVPVCNPPLPGAPSIAEGSSAAADAVPGELLVKFREPMVVASRQATYSALGGREVGRIDDLGVSVVAVDPNLSLEEAAQRYRSLPNVEYVEPNLILKADFTPNDSFFIGRQQWYYNQIGATKAWDTEKGDPSVIVAVLDTGVDVTHPDLSPNIWTNPGEIAGNGVDDDGNGCVDDVHGCNFVDDSPSCTYLLPAPNNHMDDDAGHGTFASGVVAAKGNNQIGVSGVAPNVTIMPVKVLDCQGMGTASAAAEGIIYAAKEGARVINMSFGAEGGSAADLQTISAAIDEAHDRYGVVVVAAAGNSNRGIVSFPARYGKVIAVSASDHLKPDTKAPFSSWGPEVAVTAPGVDIASTLPTRFCGLEWSCFGSNQPYALGSGTSFSTPLVSGAAALILSKGPMSPDQVKNRLMKTALDLPDGIYPHWDGAGRIQIDLALVEAISFQVGASGVTKN